MKATPLPAADAPLEEQIAARVGGQRLDLRLRRHRPPGDQLPCARIDGLPVGLMVVGPTFGEEVVLRVARACEVTCSA